MPRLGSFYGVVGIILLLFAGVAYFLTRLLSAYVFLHALLGLLALNSYRYGSDKISYAIVDPDKQPDLAERFHISAVPAVHLQYGDHTNVVNKISEEELTNGIIKVARAEKKAVYFLEGHGEPSVNEMEEPKGYG